MPYFFHPSCKITVILFLINTYIPRQTSQSSFNNLFQSHFPKLWHQLVLKCSPFSFSSVKFDRKFGLIYFCAAKKTWQSSCIEISRTGRPVLLKSFEQRVHCALRLFMFDTTCIGIYFNHYPWRFKSTKPPPKQMETLKSYLIKSNEDRECFGSRSCIRVRCCLVSCFDGIRRY